MEVSSSTRACRVSSISCTGNKLITNLSQEKEERIAVLETENAVLHLQIALVRTYMYVYCGGVDTSHLMS